MTLQTTTTYRSVFFFNDTATTEIYTLSLHDALPIYQGDDQLEEGEAPSIYFWLLSHDVMSAFSPSPPGAPSAQARTRTSRSEEHTSELQARLHLVCRLLLQKKKPQTTPCSAIAEPVY